MSIQSHKPFPRKDAGAGKDLTDYAPQLALKRSRFYLDVMEAHFAELAAFLEEAKAQGAKTVALPGRLRTPRTDDMRDYVENIGRSSTERAG